MTTCLPLWLLAAALGQAPAQDGLLDAVPAEADVVLRAKGLAPVRDDLIAMLKAASPTVAAQAEPAFEAAMAQVKEHVGDAASTPFVVAIRAVAPENPGPPPVMFILKVADYEAFLKGIADDKDVQIKHEEGGVDSFPEKGSGNPLYAAKAGGLVGFGVDRVLVASFAKGGKSLGKGLAPAIRAKFLSGDVGAYVNASALTGRYADQIAQAKQGLMGALDQAGQQGNAAMMDMAKSMYAGLFDSLKGADALALSLDFSPEGATLDGTLALKSDSKTLQSIAGAIPGDPSALAKLPADASSFFYFNLDPKSFESFQKFGMSMMSPGGKPTPELEAALARQRAAGRVEMIGAMTMAKGMQMFSVYKVDDPKALNETTQEMMKAVTSNDSPLNLYKDVKITPGAETYGGLTFSRIDMTIDPDKVAKLAAGNPAQAEQMKNMFGGDKITSWYGVGDKQVVQIMAPDWDKAKAQIDAYQKGEGGLGSTPTYRAAMARMPKGANVLFFLSLQGMIRQVTTQLGAPAPADLPKDPVLIGFALTTLPGTGFDFRLSIPSSVGPIIEKMAPRGAQ